MNVRNNFTSEEIIKALKKFNGNITEAAKSLKVARKTFSDWVHKEFQEHLPKKEDQKEKVKRVPISEANPESKLNLHPKKLQRLVVTCAQNNTALHDEFVDALLKYCDHNDAQLIVIPIRYKNVSAYMNGEEYEVWWPNKLEPYYLNEELVVNKNLTILGDLKIQATASSPLSGIGPLAKKRSAIIGHSQLQMQMIPTPLNELPRQLLTTGTVSRKNYSTSKTGKQAEFHHTYSAIVVEVDGDLFWTRQIHATSDDDGSFYDLDIFYTSGLIDKEIRAEAVVYGDLHNDFLDENVIKATWTGEDSLIKLLKPKRHFLHDVLDTYSVNHHHKGQIYTQYAKHHSGKNNIKEELDRLVQRHNMLWTSDDSLYYYVDSNHHNALTRWLQECDPRQDPENALFYHEMQVEMLSRVEMTQSGAAYPNPLELYLRNRIFNPGNTYFPSRGEDLVFNGIDYGQHGDVGANGARGSINSFAKSGYKSITGHAHTPGIEKGAYRTGTSSLLRLEYNQRGYSSWLHTHCLTYPNGKRTLINIIGDRWRR